MVPFQLQCVFYTNVTIQRVLSLLTCFWERNKTTSLIWLQKAGKLSNVPDPLIVIQNVNMQGWVCVKSVTHISII